MLNKYKTKVLLESGTYFDSFFDSTKEGKKKLSYRAKRYISVILLHLLFFLSFAIDIQVLEGTLNGSRLLGFHLIDPFTTLEVYLATFHMPINLLIGTATIVIVYLILGGRSYCSWVCPYGIISEIGEKLNSKLVKKGVIKSRNFDHKSRYIFWALFLGLSFFTGYIVFETINIVGILSRAIVYGWSIALILVLVVFFMEVFFARRFWCKQICPIGTTYSILGWAGATKIEWNDSCDHCMACHSVCFENHVLELTKAKYDAPRKEKGIKTEYVKSGDCTLCGRCIDVCHTDALKIDFRLKSIV